MAEGPTRGQIVLVERFTKWAKKTFIPVLIIGHNDKGGNYAGPAFLKHEVDSHMNVWTDKESGERMFGMSKNRFGGNTEGYTFRITSDGVHIGSEWWNIVESRTESEVLDIVMDFKSSKAGEQINWLKFRDSATSIINHLNKKYATEFAEKTFIKDPKKIKLTWEGNRAFCAYNTGQLNFGNKWITKITDKNWKGVGYRSEKPYVWKFAKNKEEAAIWAVLHEWVHLFKGYQKHTKTMWTEIARIAAAEPWMWSNISAA